MIVFFLVLILCVEIYFLQKKIFSYWKERNVPFAKPTIFVGNILSLLIGKLHASELIRELYKSTNSPYLGFFIFNQPFILIRDLKMVKHILVKDFDNFMNHTIETSKYDKLGLKMLVLNKDLDWKISRKNVSTIFSLERLKSMFSTMNEVCDDLIEYIGKMKDQSVNSREVSIKFGADVMSSCFIGMKANALTDKNSKFYRQISKFLEVTFIRGIQTISCIFIPQILNIFNFTFIDKGSMAYVEKIFLEILKSREASGLNKNDIVDILMQFNRNSNNQLDKSYMVSLALSFLAAGYETVGSSLTFLFYELGCNQLIQQRLRSEILSVLEDEQELSYQSLNKIKYLDMVINESLRKYPVVGFLDRRCGKTYKVPGTNLIIEKGTGVYISLLGTHYDEQYFPNPERFDPERFSPENQKVIPECVHMPFGKGLRGCIGSRFAMLAMKLAVAKTICNFQIDLNEYTLNPMIFDKKSVFLAPLNVKLYLSFKRLYNENVNE